MRVLATRVDSRCHIHLGDELQELVRVEELSRRNTEYEAGVTQLSSDSVPIKPQRLMSEVSRILRPSDVVVSDTGNMLSWTIRFLRLKETGKVYLPAGGMLGSSFALAIGASFAVGKDRR